jgi:regulation of enolase protein 1 (concanavalin A-like superfamily)
MSVAGRLASNQPAHSAVLIDDRGQRDEYWFPAYLSRIASDGGFRFHIGKPARVRGRYRLLFCFDNGLVTGNGAYPMFSQQGFLKKPYSFVDGGFQFVTPSIPAGRSFAAAFRDDFDGSLKPGWRWIDPKADSLHNLEARNGFLRISVNGYHDLWPGSGDYTAPRLVREVNGDFTLETKLAGPDRWCGGLLVWKDEDNFVRLDRGIFFRNDISLAASSDGEYVSVAHEFVQADPVWLRLARAGSTYTASYSQDGERWFPLKRSYVRPMRDAPKALEDGMSLLAEQDLSFRPAATSIEMKAPDPLLVGVSGIVSGVALPNGISRSSTDYDYFAVKGR